MAAPRPPAGRIVLTYDDYRRLPNDGRRYELWEGVLQATPAPSPRHQDVSRNLERLLDQHVHAHRLGKVYYAPIDVGPPTSPCCNPTCSSSRRSGST